MRYLKYPNYIKLKRNKSSLPILKYDYKKKFHLITKYADKSSYYVATLFTHFMRKID